MDRTSSLQSIWTMTAPQPSWRFRAVLACAALLACLLACGTGVTTVVTRLDRAAASDLVVSVVFRGALVVGTTTTVSVLVYHRASPQAIYSVAFTGGQTLSVDGVAIPEDDSAGPSEPPRRTVTIGREAPGANVYTFVYTDERGHQTTARVPGPREDFAFLELGPGSKIALPKPIGPASALPATTPLPRDPRPPALVHTVAVRYALPYAPDDLPASTSAASTTYTAQFAAWGSCVSAWPGCSWVGERNTGHDPLPASGLALLDDESRLWGAGFEAFGPGPGSIRGLLTVGWSLPATGFAHFHVEFDDAISVPVLWTQA